MKTFSRRCDPSGGGARRRGLRSPAALALLLALSAAGGDAFPQDRAAVPLTGKAAAGAHRMIEPGAAAPGFALKDIGGEPFDFEAEKAKSPFVMVFFSMFCEPCRRQLAVAQGFHEKHQGAGWRVVAVALDGEPLKNSVDGFLRQEGYGFRVLMDELDARDLFKTADLYGVVEIPATFVIEKGGRVAFGRKGPVAERELEKFLQPAKKP